MKATSRSGSPSRLLRTKPSGAYEFPHLVTGDLRKSIGYEMSKDQARVGSGIGSPNKAGYAIYLEFGTSKMAPRPFLRRTIFENKDRLKAILAGKA